MNPPHLNPPPQGEEENKWVDQKSSPSMGRARVGVAWRKDSREERASSPAHDIFLSSVMTRPMAETRTLTSNAAVHPLVGEAVEKVLSGREISFDEALTLPHRRADPRARPRRGRRPRHRRLS